MSSRPPAPPHVCRLLTSPWPELVAVELDSAHCFPRHFHEVYGVGIIDRGAHRSASRRGEVDAFPGDLITTNPGDVHDGRPLGCERRRWRIVYIEPSLLVSATPGEPTPGDLCEPVQRPDAFTHAVRRLLHRLGSSGTEPPDTLACEEALQAVLACWPRREAGRRDRSDAARAAGASRPDPVVDRMCAQLAADGGAPPSLESLAASAGMTRFQAFRHFRRRIGMPPHAWRLALQAERARGHIDRGRSLADAAVLAGFADQSHLTRVFARQFGFTPGTYRRARRRPAPPSAQ